MYDKKYNLKIILYETFFPICLVVLIHILQTDCGTLVSLLLLLLFMSLLHLYCTICLVRLYYISAQNKRL